MRGSLFACSIAFAIVVAGSISASGCSPVTRDFGTGGGSSSSGASSAHGGSSSTSSATGATGGGGASATSSVSSSTGGPMGMDLYVDPTMGADSNAGTKSAPLKTLYKALSLAVSGHTIFLAAGTYDATTGEKFGLPVPDNVNVIGTQDAQGNVTTIHGSTGKSALIAAGTAQLQNLVLDGFDVTVAATSGTLVIQNVKITVPMTATGVSVGGTAKVNADQLQVSGGTNCVALSGTSTLDMTNGSLGDSGPSCFGGIAALLVSQTAQAHLSGTVLANNLGSGVDARDKATVTLDSGVLIQTSGDPMCSGGGVQVENNANVTLLGVTITGSPSAAIYLPQGQQGEVAHLNVDQGSLLSGNGTGISIYQGKATLSNSKIDSSMYSGIEVRGANASADLTNMTVSSNLNAAIYVDLEGQVRVRGSNLAQNALGLLVFGSGAGAPIDLGTAADLGNNLFQNMGYELEISYTNSGVFTNAAGNTFAPNDGGTDGAGHFMPGKLVCGPFGSQHNISLSPPSCVQF